MQCGLTGQVSKTKHGEEGEDEQEPTALALPSYETPSELCASVSLPVDRAWRGLLQETTLEIKLGNNC